MPLALKAVLILELFYNQKLQRVLNCFLSDFYQILLGIATTLVFDVMVNSQQSGSMPMHMVGLKEDRRL